MDFGIGVDGVAFDYRVIQIIVALPKILNLFGLFGDDGLLQVDATVGLIGVGLKGAD
jgi:hypothetical protein